MINNKKLIFIGYFFLLILIFLGIFWLVFSSSSGLKIKQNSQAFVNLGLKRLNDKFSSILNERITSYKKSFQDNSKNNQAFKAPKKITPQTNLTDYLAYLILDQGEKKKNNQDSYNKLVSEIGKKEIFKTTFFYPNDFKTAPTSRESIKRIASLVFTSFNYVNVDTTATREAFQAFNDNQDASKLLVLANNLKEIIDYLKTFPVPEKYKPLMAEYLNLVSQERNYYLALVNYKKDPLKAYLAVSGLEAIGKELAFFIIKIDRKFRLEDKIYHF